MKNAVFWDVAPDTFVINRRFGGTCSLHLQGRKNPQAKKSVSMLFFAHRGLSSLKVAYSGYGVPWLAEQMDYTAVNTFLRGPRCYVTAEESFKTRFFLK
jgi:hypothetical protein